MAVPYFAFGSNMRHERLTQRVPSARAVGVAVLGNHALRFNKLSKKDGSGKANIEPSPDPRAVVYGVLFHLDEAERPALDRAEGGYRILRVMVRREGAGADEEAFTYIAKPEAIRDGLRPFRWYRDAAIAGARQHGLPESCIRRIEAVEVLDGPGG